MTSNKKNTIPKNSMILMKTLLLQKSKEFHKNDLTKDEKIKILEKSLIKGNKKE